MNLFDELWSRATKDEAVKMLFDATVNRQIDQDKFAGLVDDLLCDAYNAGREADTETRHAILPQTQIAKLAKS